MFYGRKIIALTFVTNFVAVGFNFYSIGAFYLALTADFGKTKLGIAAGIVIMNCVNGLLAPMLGASLDKGNARNMMFLGGSLMGIGLILASRIQSLWQYYALMATMLGLGAAMFGNLPGTKLVANWYVRQRGMALGISTMGVSLSGMVMGPVAIWAIAVIGWRHTFVIYGIIALILILPLVWFFVINRPEDIGQQPDGDPNPVPEPPPDPATETSVDESMPAPVSVAHPSHMAWSAREALTDRNFWAISFAIAFNMCCNGAILIHLIPFAVDQGIGEVNAGWVQSATAGVGVLGKIFFGWVTDRIDKKFAMWLSNLFQGAGVLMFVFVGHGDFWLIMAAGATYGFGMGGMMPLWGSLVGATFGRYKFGRIMGLMSPCMLPIQSLGIPLAAYISDHTGSYKLAFEIFFVIYILAFVALAFLRIPKLEPGQRPAPA